MLRWCSYCQQFLGEIPDYRKLTITHGICTGCEPRALYFTGPDFELAEMLRGIQHQLQEAGRRNDLAAAEHIIETACGANIRAVDVLIGIIAPMLSEFGEDWSCNVLSVAEEHQFTSYCNSVFHVVASKVTTGSPGSGDKEPDVLVMNAPGNNHILAIRIICLWLRNKGVGVQMIDVPPPLEELTALIVASGIRTVLISMALVEHRRSVESIAGRIAALPASIRPRIIVGGYAVKAGLVSAIAGAELMADISLL
jgi:methanogenic corrinoid protein MtbC1